MLRSKYSVVICFLCIGSVNASFFWGCRTRDGVHRPTEIKSILDTELPDSPVSISQRSSEGDGIEVYLDGSWSCAGFIREPDGSTGGTEYCDFLHALRAWLSPRTDVTYFKFGASGQPWQVGGCEQACVRAFYDQRATLFVQLIDILAQKEDLPTAILIVTDGVPTSGDFISAVQAVLALTDRGCDFHLFGMRSTFYGEVFSQCNNNMLAGYYDSSQHGPRPFYCFVFSLSPHVQKELGDQLSHNGIRYDYLNFSSEVFQTTTPICSVPSKLASGVRNPIRRHSQRDDLVYLQWRPDAHPSARGAMDVWVNLILESDASQFRLGSQSLDLRTICLDLDSESMIPPTCRLDGFRHWQDSRGRIRVQYSFSFQKAVGYDRVGYKIMVYPEANTFLPPRWVEEWSVDQDTSLSDFRGTLFLQDFVEIVMTRARFRRKALAAFYVVMR